MSSITETSRFKGFVNTLLLLFHSDKELIGFMRENDLKASVSRASRGHKS